MATVYGVPSPSPSELSERIRSYVAEGTGIVLNYVVDTEVDWDTPAPSEQYASVTLVRDVSEGQAYRLNAGLEDDQTIIQSQRVSRIATFSAQIIGSGAEDRMVRLLNWMESDPEDWFSASKGIRVERGEWRDLTTVEWGEYEPRHQIDLTVRYYQDTFYDIGAIEEVAIEIEVHKS